MPGWIAVTLLFSAITLRAQAAELSPPEKYQQAMALILLSSTTTEQFQGLEMLRASASQGFGPAQTALATLLENGTFVMQDVRQAVEWYKKSAAQGDWIAQFALGRMYFLSGPIARDTAESKKWLTMAAAAGSSGAAFYLGLMHDENQDAGPDYAVARKWYRQAAESGNAFAQLRLAQLLAQGLGGERDRQQAYMWSLVSFQLGNDNAAALSQSLEFDIGQSGRDIGKAQALAVLDQVVENRTTGCHGWKGEFGRTPTAPPLARQQTCERIF